MINQVDSILKRHFIYISENQNEHSQFDTLEAMAAAEMEQGWLQKHTDGNLNIQQRWMQNPASSRNKSWKAARLEVLVGNTLSKSWQHTFVSMKANRSYYKENSN